MLFDVSVAAVAVGVHCDDGREVLHFELPNGFWSAELVVVIDVWNINAKYGFLTFPLGGVFSSPDLFVEYPQRSFHGIDSPFFKVIFL